MAEREETVRLQPLTRCVYCGAEHPRMMSIPLADDYAAWEAIAEQHAANCRWATTRAGRLPAKSGSRAKERGSGNR